MRVLAPLILSLVVVPLCLAQGLTRLPNYGEPNGGFPNWQERAVQELTNRARVEPSADLAACPAEQCLEEACYPANAPLAWTYPLNQAARFHSASMARFPFFDHNTPCTLFTDIAARFPGSSDGSVASSCSSPQGTTTAQNRVLMFAPSYTAENAAAGHLTPHQVFYAWLYETTSSSACGFRLDNGHRYNILANGGSALGVGYDSVPATPYVRYWTQDFGSGAVAPKIPSGSHWTSVDHLRDPVVADDSVEFWVNWYDVAGGAPTQANLVLDGGTVATTLARGTATNGAYSVIATGVASGCHTYYFSFVDFGVQPVRYPTTGVLGFGAGCPDWQASSPPAVPTGVIASATSGTQVLVTWNAATGATSYEVYRRVPGGSFAPIGTSMTASFTDAPAASNTSYLYRIRAVGAGGTSADSAYDLATTVMFTADPLMPGVDVVNAIHLAELRTAVNAVRTQANLLPATFTDLAVPGVVVRAVHIDELRIALDAAMSALALATGGYTDAIAPGVSVKAVHFQEIRNRVQ